MKPRQLARLLAIAPRLYHAALAARAQLGDIIREGKGTDDDVEVYTELGFIIGIVEGAHL